MGEATSSLSGGRDNMRANPYWSKTKLLRGNSRGTEVSDK